jgi:hypothetical protein
MQFLSSFLAVLLSTLLIALPVPAQPAAADAPLVADSIQLRLVSPPDGSFQVNSLSKGGLEVAVTDATGIPVPDAAVVFRLPDSGATGTFPDGSRSIVRYTDASGRASAPAIHWNNAPGPVWLRITAAKGAGHAGLLLDTTLTQAGATAAPMQVNRLQAKDEPAPLSEAKTQGEPASLASPPPAHQTDSESDEVDLVRSGASGPAVPVSDEAPSVSITSASPADGPHISKKWIILAAVAVAAGVGAMMALHGGGGSSSGTSSAGVSIGSPSISIGHP